jgi:hypothetical protein
MRISFPVKRLGRLLYGRYKDEAFELFISDNDSKSAARKRLVIIIIIIKRQMLQKFNYRPSESARSKRTRMLQQCFDYKLIPLSCAKL